MLVPEPTIQHGVHVPGHRTVCIWHTQVDVLAQRWYLYHGTDTSVVCRLLYCIMLSIFLVNVAVICLVIWISSPDLTPVTRHIRT